MTKPRKRMARNWARNFAAGLLEHQEIMFRDNEGLTEEELEIAQDELRKLSERIKSRVDPALLPNLGN